LPETVSNGLAGFFADFPKDSEFKDDFTMHFDTLVDDKLLIEV